jgi:hypothetical protein
VAKRKSRETRETQFEQENFLGRGGGEVDESTMAEAWREADRRRSAANIEREASPGDAGAEAPDRMPRSR